MLHENTFRQLKIAQTRILDSLTHPLPGFANLEAKQSIVQLRFYGTITNSPVGCAFCGSNKYLSIFHRIFH